MNRKWQEYSCKACILESHQQSNVCEFWCLDSFENLTIIATRDPLEDLDNVLVNHARSIAMRQVCDVQVQLVLILQVQNILFVPYVSEDIQVGKLGVGPVAPVTTCRPLQVFAQVAT